MVINLLLLEFRVVITSTNVELVGNENENLDSKNTRIRVVGVRSNGSTERKEVTVTESRNLDIVSFTVTVDVDNRAGVSHVQSLTTEGTGTSRLDRINGVRTDSNATRTVDIGQKGSLDIVETNGTIVVEGRGL